MKTYQIYHHHTGDTLFAGAFKSFKNCLETAVQERILLNFADLRRANLVNAMLDDARLDYALFTQANLMGANLSDAQLKGANFNHASLQNACLCYAILPDACFNDAQFGDTNLTGAVIDRAIFSAGSAFQLAYRDAAAMAGCTFIHADNAATGFSRPPLVINGLDYPIVLTDHHITLGFHVLTHAEFAGASQIEDHRMAQFIQQHKVWLAVALEQFRA